MWIQVEWKLKTKILQQLCNYQFQEQRIIRDYQSIGRWYHTCFIWTEVALWNQCVHCTRAGYRQAWYQRRHFNLQPLTLAQWCNDWFNINLINSFDPVILGYNGINAIRSIRRLMLTIKSSIGSLWKGCALFKIYSHTQRCKHITGAQKHILK